MSKRCPPSVQTPKQPGLSDGRGLTSVQQVSNVCPRGVQCKALFTPSRDRDAGKSVGGLPCAASEKWFCYFRRSRDARRLVSPPVFGELPIGSKFCSSFPRIQTWPCSAASDFRAHTKFCCPSRGAISLPSTALTCKLLAPVLFGGSVNQAILEIEPSKGFPSTSKQFPVLAHPKFGGM